MMQIKFMGIRSKKYPFNYNIDFGDAICEFNSTKKVKSKFGQNLLGQFTSKMRFQIRFLGYETGYRCICSHILGDKQVELLSYLSNHEYELYFKINEFEIKKGLKISDHGVLFTKYKFEVRYIIDSKDENETYEIVDIFPVQEFGHQSKIENDTCIEMNSIPTIRTNTSIGFTYEFIFTETNIAPQTYMYPISMFSSINLQLLINIVILFFLLFFTPKYTNSFGPLEEENDDSIWYYLRGDMFRIPKLISILCSFVGIGIQFIISAVFISFQSYNDIGEILAAFCSSLAFNGFFSGLISTYIFKSVGGYEWRNVYKAILTVVPSFYVIIFCIRSIFYIVSNSASIPTNGTVLRVLVLVLYHTIAVSIGAGIGVKLPANDSPCKVNMIPRHIPSPVYYLSPGFLRLYGGLYIFLQLIRILFALYESDRQNILINAPKYLITLIILLLITSSANVSIALTFLKAKHDDYQWWWNSFIAPAFVASFYLIYCLIIHYLTKEFVFISFLFSLTTYLAQASFLLFVCGASGFICTFVFLYGILSKYTI